MGWMKLERKGGRSCRPAWSVGFWVRSKQNNGRAAGERTISIDGLVPLPCLDLLALGP